MSEGKIVAVITGASSGIGFATSEYLADRGFRVFGISRHRADTTKFKWIEGDVSNHAQMEQILKHIYDEAGRIDVLINNAGMGISGPVEDTTREMIDGIFSINVTALIDCCALCLPYLRKSHGTIINVGSVGGVTPLPFQACYSASKSAVEVFSHALAGEVRKCGVKVTCIRPGDTCTGFTDSRIKAPVSKDGAYNKSSRESISKMEKDERNGKGPDTVARVIYKCLTKKRPSPVVTVGFTYKVLCVLAKFLPKRLVNRIMELLYG